MRFICLFVFVGTLVTAATATAGSEIKYCITNCPLATSATAVCGLLENSDTDFQYKDFIDGCALNNANCGVTDPTKLYTAISEAGVTCAQLADILSPTISILPVPVIGTAVPVSA